MKLKYRIIFNTLIWAVIFWVYNVKSSLNYKLIDRMIFETKNAPSKSK